MLLQAGRRSGSRSPAPSTSPRRGSTAFEMVKRFLMYTGGALREVELNGGRDEPDWLSCRQGDPVDPVRDDAIVESCEDVD